MHNIRIIETTHNMYDCITLTYVTQELVTQSFSLTCSFYQTCYVNDAVESMVKDGLDSIRGSVELNKASNMYYLEMQYKFMLASRNFGVISNLMKVRSESTKKAINEIK